MTATVQLTVAGRPTLFDVLETWIERQPDYDLSSADPLAPLIERLRADLAIADQLRSRPAHTLIVGTFFAHQRDRAGLTQEDVGTACHVSRVAVSHWESGRTPAPEAAWRLILAWNKGLLEAYNCGLLVVAP